MLKCREISQMASDYTEKSLTWHQSLGYSMHLLMCGHCRLFVRQLRTTVAYTRALPEPEALSDSEVAAVVAKATAAS